MAKKEKVEANSQPVEIEKSKPWISMRSGLTIIIIVSIGMGAWTGYQLYSQGADTKLVLQQALISFGMVWVVFGIMLLFFKFTRR